MRLGSTAEIPSKAAARSAADRYLARTAPSQLHAGRVLAWPAWCDRYIETQLAMLASGTRATQASVIDNHLRPAFSCNVHEIDRAAVQTFVLEQYRAGAAPATVRARFSVLRRMLRQAAAEGLAAMPPDAGSIKVPKHETPTPAISWKAFESDELSRILATAPDPQGTAFALATYLGLRAGEVLGMAWSAIDLTTGAVTVRQQALDRRLVVLKTRGSQAVLRAPTLLLDRLRTFHANWTPNPAQLLFADAQGRPWTAAHLRGLLHELLHQLGIRRRGMHAFRHSCALAMASAGCNPEAIRRALRHGSMQTTAAYLAASPEDVAAGLERAANLVKARTGDGKCY